MTRYLVLRVYGMAVGVTICGTLQAAQRGQPYPAHLPTDHAAIGYDAGPFKDPIAQLAGTSDLIALMTLEHQTQMTNLLTRAAWEARVADHDGLLDETETAARRRSVEAIVQYMLFADEAPLRNPIQGVSSFTETFPTPGPTDRRGRSLRDLDLRTRLFRYPLSYMVYSDLFDGLPDPMRAVVYERLFEVLQGDAAIDRVDRLSTEDRQALLEIVRETKPGLPAYWRAQ